jgi:LPXTG-site transpeptidase (sortase) family protein
MNNVAIKNLNNTKHPIRSGMFSPASKFIPILLLLVGLGLVGWQIQRSNVPIPTNSFSSNSFQPKPAKVRISKINVDAPVVDLGLNADGTLQVPQEGGDVGWYTKSPSPGAMGPAVMVGHLDTIKTAGVFYNLHKLQPGDEVEIEREDGSIAVFKIDSTEKYSQDNFPTDKVYGAIDHAGIRLITCSGTYSLLKGRYSDNLVVYGSLDRIVKPL